MRTKKEKTLEIRRASHFIIHGFRFFVALYWSTSLDPQAFSLIICALGTPVPSALSCSPIPYEKNHEAVPDSTCIMFSVMKDDNEGEEDLSGIIISLYRG